MVSNGTSSAAVRLWAGAVLLIAMQGAGVRGPLRMASGRKGG